MPPPGFGEPVATVSADANALYLGLWKRLDLLENSQIDGDRTAVRQALARPLAP